MNPIFYTARECGKAYKVPGFDHIIPEGAKVLIPIVSCPTFQPFLKASQGGLHYDPDIWGDPDVFRPSRFSPENKGKIPAGGYLPFGLGPR